MFLNGFSRAGLSLALVFAGMSIAMAQGRAVLTVETEPNGAEIFLDGNSDAESMKTPFENDAMIVGEHSIRLVPPSESFVPAFYEFETYAGKPIEVRHRFLHRNHSFDAVALSPNFLDFEAVLGAEYFRYLQSENSGSNTNNSEKSAGFGNADFRLGLPLGFGLRAGFPMSVSGVMQTNIGIQWTYFPLQIGVAADYVNPRGAGFSALRLTLLTMRDVYFLNILANAVYEVGEREGVEFYARAGFPAQHIFMPFLVLRERLIWGENFTPLEEHLFSVELGALLQVGNSVSLMLGVPVSLFGRSDGPVNVKEKREMGKGFGIYFGIQGTFNFERSGNIAEAKRSQNNGSAIIWDVNEVSNAEFRKWKGESWKNDDFPAASVSLQDAVEYAKWMGKRLPTAEEWRRKAAEFENGKAECALPTLKKASDGEIVNGVRNFMGNAAEWLAPADGTELAYFGGASDGASAEYCKRKAMSVDVSSKSGGKFIGFRLVKDLQPHL